MNNKRDSLFTYLCSEEEISIVENFELFECSFKSRLIVSIDENDFKASLDFLSDRDYLILSLTVNSSDPVQYDSRKSQVTSFIKEVADLFQYLDDTDEIDVSFEIKIYKNKDGKRLSVYSLANFTDFLEGLSFTVFLNEFAKVSTAYESLIFELICDDAYLKTDRILLTANKGEDVTSRQSGSQIIGNAKSSCHFTPLSKHEFTPSDFFVTESNYEQLSSVFSKVCVILSIGFIYDILDVKSTGMATYRLNGYKTLTGEIDLGKVNINGNMQYYNIFSWIYGTGTFIDKLGLARNIISLHIEGVNNVDIKGDPILAIQSSYKVYEKQNIKQYIEIRNKISDQLLGFHDRANKIVEAFASGFQKSSLALITFYISAIVLRILKSDDLVNIFTIDAAILSTAFIACSWGYYYALDWEVSAQKERFKRHYTNIKDRYRDLLDNQDISRILNNDKEFKQDLEFMDRKVSSYRLLWFFELGLLLLATWGIYCIYNQCSG